MSEPEVSEDYVWHFKLGGDARSSAGSSDALAEMVRRQIRALLQCVQFTSDGRDMRVTGFRFLNDLGHEHTLGFSLPTELGEPEE